MGMDIMLGMKDGVCDLHLHGHWMHMDIVETCSLVLASPRAMVIDSHRKPLSKVLIRPPSNGRFQTTNSYNMSNHLQRWRSGEISETGHVRLITALTHQLISNSKLILISHLITSPTYSQSQSH